MGQLKAVPAPRATRAEIAEAMNNARPLVAQLRAALDKRDRLGPAPLLRVAAGIRETIGSLRADIRSIANRAYIDADALICLLTEEDRIHRSSRRKPSFDQLVRAVSRAMSDSANDLLQAHEASTAAQSRLEQQTRATVAINAAGALLGIAS